MNYRNMKMIKNSWKKGKENTHQNWDGIGHANDSLHCVQPSLSCCIYCLGRNFLIWTYYTKKDQRHWLWRKGQRRGQCGHQSLTEWEGGALCTKARLLDAPSAQSFRCQVVPRCACSRDHQEAGHIWGDKKDVVAIRVRWHRYPIASQVSK